MLVEYSVPNGVAIGQAAGAHRPLRQRMAAEAVAGQGQLAAAAEPELASARAKALGRACGATLDVRNSPDKTIKRRHNDNGER